MVKIKLTRFGRKKSPFYKIVVIGGKTKMGAKPVDTLGYWNPKENKLKIDSEKLKTWTEKGAQPTIGVAKLLQP